MILFESSQYERCVIGIVVVRFIQLENVNKSIEKAQPKTSRLCLSRRKRHYMASFEIFLFFEYLPSFDL